MSVDLAIQHETEAQEYRSCGQYRSAGDWFTSAAFIHIGQGPLQGYGERISHGLVNLLHAAVCYRLAGDNQYCKNRCEYGKIMAREVGERLRNKHSPKNSYDKARLGAWNEFIGDFQLISESEDYQKIYNDAKEYYKTAEELDLGFAEQEHLRLIGFYEDMIKGAGKDIDEWHDMELSLSFPEWIDYKIERMPELYQNIIDSGEWGNNN